MKEDIIFDSSLFVNLDKSDLCEVTGGNAPVLIAGACMIGMAGAGPIGCAGGAIFAWGYYNGYEGAKRGS